MLLLFFWHLLELRKIILSLQTFNEVENREPFFAGAGANN
jgi:hypothetical protein